MLLIVIIDVTCVPTLCWKDT